MRSRTVTCMVGDTDLRTRKPVSADPTPSIDRSRRGYNLTVSVLD